MSQFYENTVNPLDPRPQNGFIPWVLHPVDLNTTVRENDRSLNTVGSSSKPGPNLSTSQSGSASVPIDLPDISYAVLKSLLANISQDQNITSARKDANSKPVSPSSKPQAIAMKPSSPIKDIVKKPTEVGSSKNVRNELKIEKENEARKFIKLVHKFPHLYNTEDPDYRNEDKKAKSWAVISEILNMTEYDCRRRWEVLRNKYSAEIKQLTMSADYASKKSTQFINETNLPSHQKETSAERNEVSATEEHRSVRLSEKRKKSRSPSRNSSPSKKRKKSKSPSPPRSVSSSKKLNKTESRSRSNTISSRKRKKSESPSQNPSRKPDQSFVDDIALELQRFSPRQKILIKAKIWQVLAEFGDPV